MRRTGAWKGIFVVLALGVGLGAAPATPSYYLTLSSIETIEQNWSKPGATPDPNAPGWISFFDAIKAELNAYSQAENSRDRLVALSRLYQMSVTLSTVAWEPAARVRESLRSWLRPRVRLAWAERRLVERVRGLPPTQAQAALSNRQRWLAFVNDDLEVALRKYDRAATVPVRYETVQNIQAALEALEAKNQASPWAPSVSLEQALRDLFDLPNLDLSADVPTLRPYLEHDVVVSGPIYRKGYVSQVTAGAKTGFGLMPSDQGVAFYNSQMLSSVTPIWDFQQQIERDRRGRRAARLYHFDATSTDAAELTIVATLAGTGLSLYPSYRHNADALIASLPQPGRALGRFIAALVGFNQDRITEKVYEGAIGQIQQNIVTEAQELGQEKANQAAAQENVKLAKSLVGGNRLLIKNIEIERLSLRSTPQFALVGGALQWLDGGRPVGVDAPQPPRLATPESGVTADVHVGSVLSGMVRGYYKSPKVQSVQNVMIVTRDVPPDAPPREKLQVVENAPYATFLGEVKRVRQEKNPKVVAIRIKRPGTPPMFSSDARGFLVALVRDFELEVPAPEQQPNSGFLSGAAPPAQVYRIVSPEAEFVVSFSVKPESPGGRLRLTGRLEGFDPGPRAQVLAVNEDENKTVPLTTLTGTVVLGVVRAKLQGQPVDLPVEAPALQRVDLHSISPLDPSGWMRVVLTVKPGAIPTSPPPVTSAPGAAPAEPSRVSQR